MAVLREVFGWLNIIGLPAIVGWALYDRRRIRNEAKRGDLENTEAEKTLPDRVRTSSVISLEAEILALKRTFEIDRDAKDATIAFIRKQLDDERAESAAKDEKIDVLQTKVAHLQRQVRSITEDLTEVQRELAQAKSTVNGKKDIR